MLYILGDFFSSNITPLLEALMLYIHHYCVIWTVLDFCFLYFVETAIFVKSGCVITRFRCISLRLWYTIGDDPITRQIKIFFSQIKKMTRIFKKIFPFINSHIFFLLDISNILTAVTWRHVTSRDVGHRLNNQFVNAFFSVRSIRA